MGLRLRPFGHPPFLPFSRAARALASLVTFPPRLPRATAAGFLRGEDIQRFLLANRGGVEAMRFQHLRNDAPEHVREALGIGQRQGHGGVGGAADGVSEFRHGQILGEALGYCQHPKPAGNRPVFGVSA